MKGAAALALCLLLAACSPRGAPPAGEPPAVSLEEAAPGSRAELPAPPEESPHESPEAPSAPSVQAPPAQEPSAQEEAPLPPVEAAPQEGAPPVEELFAVARLTPELAEHLTGNSWKEGCPVALEELRLVTVTHLNFEGEACRGELVVHAQLAQEVADIFRELYEADFPLGEVRLVEAYGCDDSASMAAGNSSCFNARPIAGTDRWSMHSYGAAVDINPIQNPYITNQAPLPTDEFLDRENLRPGMITPGDACYNAFVSRGWTWGGHWPNPDYQHFEKAIAQ